ncbi:hypothetical protein [Bacillus sp. FJAT-42376]|uniref:hypothetical protein n=1 Tax=Bacillus sp. FJAT-42376 TaxID=2014076 RepID=UPI000F5029E5|nr:hypothetical protein [Bacillus sp. FJAT-42376]
MSDYKFFLEGINMQTITTSYDHPVFVSRGASIIDATKEFAKESKLKYAGHESLQSGYRIYYEKSSLLKRKTKTYIYYVTE